LQIKFIGKKEEEEEEKKKIYNGGGEVEEFDQFPIRGHEQKEL